MILHLAIPKAHHVYYVVAACPAFPSRSPRGNVGAAVVTVPAYFNDAQRQATKEPGPPCRSRGERKSMEVKQKIPMVTHD